MIFILDTYGTICFPEIHWKLSNLLVPNLFLRNQFQRQWITTVVMDLRHSASEPVNALWSDGSERRNMEEQASAWSERVLDMSGLLPESV
ncbi:MAG: hypothetical protein ICV54_00305 [Nostoc sp. C3-bin3]|nr:hypothetical protein [Nostoc sp. C3-bin3]